MNRFALRVAVTPPSGHHPIVERASSELGFPVKLTILPTERLFRAALEEPDTFDLIQAEAWMINKLKTAGSIQPIAIAEVEGFQRISTLFTEGVLAEREVTRNGVPPHTILYADESRRWLNSVPTICNGDTLGWREDRVMQTVESWGDLLEGSHAGRVVIADVPAASYLELSLACQAKGLIRYVDVGDQSPREIEDTYRILFALANDGHFYALWPSFERSVEQFATGPAAVGSLWPPAVTALKARGLPVRYGPLREGYRGWAGSFALSARLDPQRRTAAVAYVNWYLSGWAGAFLMRQGYYSAAPATARAFLAEDEWNYWQLGHSAKGPIVAPNGSEIGRRGESREGGSYEDRMSRIACWSTDMTHEAEVRDLWGVFRSKVDEEVPSTNP